MASLVLFLSFLVRPKNKNPASIVTSSSFDTIEDASILHARWAQQRECSNNDSELEEILGLKILQEPKVCIYLV